VDKEMTKKLLLTGSAGFVGAHFVDHVLANTDWDIIGIDSFRHRGDSMRVYQDPARYKIFTHDLTAPISERLINEIGHVDYIMNMASESHVDRSITDPVPFVENNVKLVLNMLEYARVIKPTLFIQMSTDEVYGPAIEGINHKEWSPILPSNPYSASKAAQEGIAISYWRSYGVPLLITNTMNMFGERQDKEKFVPSVISKVHKGEIVTVHGNEDYIGKRFYLHARNFADAIIFLIKRGHVTMYEDLIDRVIIPDRYNIVGDVEMDNLQLAQFIASTMSRELKYRLVDFHSARPGHDRRYALDGTKIANLGWKAPVSFDESLRRTVNWTLTGGWHWL
jgi:dTDP-glucose 4,6-dehydratase